MSSLLRKPLLAAVVLCICIAWPPPAAAAPDRPALVPRGDDAYIEDLHRGLLGRRPSPAEMQATRRELLQAPSRMVVQNRILDSAAFRRRVPNDAFLVGLYEQVRGRSPLAHEMILGLHSLGDEVPRSELLGAVLHGGSPAKGSSPALSRIYRDLLLDYRPSRLRRYRRHAQAYSKWSEATLRETLAAEAAALGGASPGPPASPEMEPEAAEQDKRPYNVYYGYIHAHTRVSLDALLLGSPGPFEAFRYARDVAGLDFLGLSDHSEFISTWPWRDEWRLLQRAVDANNEDGVFVALRGFEYSNPIYGHINVFGTPVFTNAFTSLTQRQFYEWLVQFPSAAATFNHPGNYDFLGIEFLHFRFFPEVRDQMVGIELLTHNAQYGQYSVGYILMDSLGYLDEANQAGWRIGSVSAQDNHEGGWGTIDEYRTGVLARALTQEDILEALRRRRFYSTQDRNLVMSFRADGREMGSILRPGDKTFTVALEDGDGEGFTSIGFYANGLLVEDRAVQGDGVWEFAVAAPEDLTSYYVLVTQGDGDQAMSAPIWVKGSGGSPANPP